MGKLIDIDVERVDGVDTPATRRRFLFRKSAVLNDKVDEADNAEFHETVRSLANSSSAVLKQIAESGGELVLDENMAGLLNEMSKALGVGLDFKAMNMKKPPMDDESDDDPADSAADEAEDAADGGADEAEEEDGADAGTTVTVKPKLKRPAAKDVDADAPMDAEAVGAAVAAALTPTLSALTKSQKLLVKRLDQLIADQEPITKSLGRSKQVRRQSVTKSDKPMEMGEGVFSDVIFGDS